MLDTRSTLRMLALAAVVLVGAGACAPDRAAESDGSRKVVPLGVSEQATGADATPAPTTPPATRSPARMPAPRPVTSSSRTVPPIPRQPAVTLRPGSSGCQQGEYQREVEVYLAKLGGFGRVIVDGRQSPTDCATIKKFQERYDIRPAKGRAGPLTFDVAKRLATTDVRSCKAGSGTTFCVDLTRQTVWAMRDGKVIMAPTVTRTGMNGYETPTGTYKINFRNVKEWSDPYEVWLPYWQRFIGGIGFHQTTTYIHNKSIGSHGCVNLLPRDAYKLWTLGKVGTPVKVFGRRPGT